MRHRSKRCFFAALVAAAVLSAQPAPAGEAPTFKQRVLHSFGGSGDGADPQAGLIAVKGTLYGTTYLGGPHGAGTVFSLDPRTGAEKVLYSFSDTSGDGALPQAGLVHANGTLYGTTKGGDDFFSSGSVFAFDLGTNTEKTLYHFCAKAGCSDGRYPAAGLLKVGSKLYGTTVGGGISGETCSTVGCGTVFTIDPVSGAQTVIHAFCSQTDCADGQWPSSGLIKWKGTLYGTTSKGGALGAGTVFSIDLKTGAERVVQSFDALEGGPFGTLLNVNGTFYGTTAGGQRGTVYALDPQTGAVTVLYRFCSLSHCPNGEGPSSGVISVNGMLVGTTAGGGAHGSGVVFAVDPDSGMETVLYSFCSQDNCLDGAVPWAGLTAVNGKIYGTTSRGGAGDSGVVFSLKEKR